MIYFDNAATGGRKPETVISAVLSSLKLCANPGRSGHKLSLAYAKKVLETRQALSDFFDGYGFEKVIFTKNCTEALNLAITGVLQKGDHVVTTCMEHNSVLRPLEELKRRGVIEYDICPIRNGNISPDDLLALVKENTAMAIVTSASNVTGTAPPLEEIRARLPERVLFVVDGAQGGGHIPIAMKKAGIDGLALAGHKGMMGIQGSGALLFSDRLAPSPVLFGGTGSESFSLAMPDFYPDRLEAGTLSYPAVLSLYEGIRYLILNFEKNAEKMLGLTDYAIDKLKKFPACKIYSEPNPCGIVAFERTDMQSEILSGELSERGFGVRGGLHCAPLMHQALRTAENGLVRISFSPFSHRAEIDAFFDALREIQVRSF